MAVKSNFLPAGFKSLPVIKWRRRICFNVEDPKLDSGLDQKFTSISNHRLANGYHRLQNLPEVSEWR